MPSRLLDLQALRGLACLLVLFYHAGEWELRTGRHLLYPVQFFGYAGVDLFFVLSGFIITWANLDHLGQPAALCSYATRRLWRIYPAYWVCWLAGMLPRFLRPGGLPSASESAAWVLLLPRPGPDLFPQASLQAGNVPVPQSWTLVYELLFYLLFAAFLLLPRRCFVPLLSAWALAVVGFTVAGGPGLGLYAGLPLQPLVLEFLLGCVAAVGVCRLGPGFPLGRPAARFSEPRLNEDRPLSPAGRGGAMGCIVLGALWFAVGGWLHYRGLSSGHLDPRHRVLCFGVPAALLVLGLTARERAGATTLPRWLRPVGDASYSIYLTHVLVFSVVCKLTAGMSHGLAAHLGWLALLTGAGLAVGYAFHLGVERPLLRRQPGGLRLRPWRSGPRSGIDGWCCSTPPS